MNDSGGPNPLASRYPMFCMLLDPAVSESGTSASRKPSISGPSKPTLSNRATHASIELLLYFNDAWLWTLRWT